MFFARSAALLVFHVLNALLAISGVSLVLAFTVLSIALVPSVLMIPALCAFVEVITKRFPDRNWVVFVLVFMAISATITLLLGFTVFCSIVANSSKLAVSGTIAQHCFVYINAIAVNLFVSLDVELANFAVTRKPLQTYSVIWRNETKLLKIPHAFWHTVLWRDGGLFLDVFTTPAMWTAAFYFIVPKLLMGVLSAISVWLSVVQPIVMLASSGRFPCVGTGLAFQDNSSVYVVSMAMFWVVGVFGLVLVPVWSVRLTAWGCGECIYDPDRLELDPKQQVQQHVQEELAPPQ